MSIRIVSQVVLDGDVTSERGPLYVEGSLEAATRTSGKVAAHDAVSFATYFNAFPAWHWHEHTAVREVLLTVTTRGGGVLAVQRSDGRGEAAAIHIATLSGSTTTQLRVDLEPNSAGGWIWFDLRAGSGGLDLVEAHWSVEAPPRETRGATISMTTLDKPGFALGVLRRLSEHPRALDVLDEVLVIDQGTRKVADEPGFAEVASALEGRLRVIDQANLGGSGGFARGMLEVLDAERSSAVILLDDDVELEPESVARAVAFARYTRAPMIVGGHMFDLNRPAVLHALNERVSSDDFDWGPIGPARHDFAAASLRATPWLHEPARPDYNGWWFCLIPTAVLTAVGLSLPVFLKWDDAEFGLRAGAAGFATVSLPGMAVWHVTWLDKDDSVGWQAYFHARNRMIAALVDRRAVGRRLARVNLALDLRYLLSMDYHVVELRHRAYADVLRGPGNLHSELATRLSEVIGAMGHFPSGRLEPADPTHLDLQPGTPRPAREGVAALAATLRQLVTRGRAVPAEPEALLAERSAGWWDVARHRHVLVASADSATVRRHVLRPRTMRLMARRALVDAFRVRRAWTRLRPIYTAALPELVAPATWRATIGHRPS